MKHAINLTGILALLIFALACKGEPTTLVKTEPITFNKEGSLSIYRAETDSVLARLDIEIADSDYETQTGLMYRDAMETNQGMLFVFPEVAMHSFYMKNTKIPLDILFIDDKMAIAHLVEEAQPMNESGLSSRVPVQYVLEINAGLVKLWGVKPGDSIAYQRN